MPYNALYQVELELQEMVFFLEQLDRYVSVTPDGFRLHRHVRKLHRDIGKLQGHLENLVLEDRQPKLYITKDGEII